MKNMSFFRSQLPNVCSDLLSAYRTEFPASCLQIFYVCFSRARKWFQLNFVFTYTGVKAIPKWKGCYAVDPVFSLIHAFLDRAINSGGIPAITTVNTFCSDLFNHLLYKKPEIEKGRIGKVVTRETIRRLKLLAKNLLKNMKIAICSGSNFTCFTTVLKKFTSSVLVTS